MRLDVKVIPRAKKDFLKQEATGIKIYLTAPAVDGKANEALIGFLAHHFHVPQRQIAIIKGLKSRYKAITINEV